MARTIHEWAESGIVSDVRPLFGANGGRPGRDSGSSRQPGGKPGSDHPEGSEGGIGEGQLAGRGVAR